MCVCVCVCILSNFATGHLYIALRWILCSNAKLIKSHDDRYRVPFIASMIIHNMLSSFLKINSKPNAINFYLFNYSGDV